MFNHISPASLWPKRWLAIAVLALAISGIFSIILVVSRTPQLIALFPWMKQLFSVSLVIHVDLSVLVWFLAVAGALFSLLPAPRIELPYLRPAAWGCVLAAIICMSFSPLTGQWEVIKSNYIPVITNPLFFAGLVLLMLGMALSALRALLAGGLRGEVLTQGGVLAAVLLLFALAAFAASALGIPAGVKGHGFYEHLFWGGGHLLQFVYVQIMLIAWVVLARQAGLKQPPEMLLRFVFWIGPVGALFAIYPYLAYEVMSQEHLDAFSLQMNVALGIGAGLVGLYYGGQLLNGRLRKDAFSLSLYASFALFILGGAFGAAINGPNVRIPAHYHGSIVAVTLALMGLAYWLLPKLGGADVSGWKMARLQPLLYGFGQILHITGLAVSGGYGVLRKSVGDVGSGGWEVKAALGMMGGGGLLAIIGGLLFVIVMTKAFRRCSVTANVK